MATKKLKEIGTIGYSVTMNDTLAKQPFCYVTAKSRDTLNLEQIAEHMASHQSPFTKGTILGILNDLPGCILELLCDGFRINLGGLGTFYVKLESHSFRLDEKGNKIQITKTGDMTDAQIDHVRVRFQPGDLCEIDRQKVTLVRELTHSEEAKAQKGAYESSGSTSGGTSLS